MKVRPLTKFAATLAAVCLVWGVGSSQPVRAQSTGSAQSDLSALKEEIETLKRLLPDQAHAMSDVDYHFSNLWFAAQNAHWPLAEFYLNETRSHLNWAVRMRPVRRLSTGSELDLREVLRGVESSGLTDVREALGKRDLKMFEAAYRNTMAQCQGCHVAAEKPFLRLQVPLAPASRMIDPAPAAK
jgi:hypothetical protein